MKGGRFDAAAVAQVCVYRVVVLVIIGVRQRQVADHERVFYAHAVRDAVNRAAQGNDGRTVVVAIDADHFIARQSFLVDSNGRRVILCVVRREENRVVDEHGIGVGQVPAVLVGVAPTLLRRTWNADNIKWRSPLGGVVGQHVIHVRVDLRTVRNAHRVFRHEEGALVEQFHVHVNVVDAIVGQHRHFDVGVHAVKVLDDLVNLCLAVVREICPPGATAVVFFQDELGGKGSSESIRHPIAAGVHQVGWFGSCGVHVDPHVVSQHIGNHVVIGPRTVVHPIDQDPVVVPAAVDGVGAIVTDPDAVVFGGDDIDIFQVERSSARGAGQVVLDFVDVIGEDDHGAFLFRCGDDLFLYAGKRCPRNGQGLDLFPFRRRAQRIKWGRGLDAARCDGLEADAFDVVAFGLGDGVGPRDVLGLKDGARGQEDHGQAPGGVE